MMQNNLTIENIKDLIVEIRDTAVIIDSDVAKLYGVQTKEINQAIKRNLDKFPEGYFLNLEEHEWNLLLKSHFVTSKQTPLNKGGKVKIPNAFTEKGLDMLATILKSKQATKTTIQIIETFTKIRDLKQDFNQVLAETDEIKKNTIGAKFGEGLMDLFLNDGLENQQSETKIKFSMFGMSLEKSIQKGK